MNRLRTKQSGEAGRPAVSRTRIVVFILGTLLAGSAWGAVVTLQHGVTAQTGGGTYAGTSDAWLSESSQRDNNGGDWELRVRYDANDGGFAEDCTVIKFELPAVSFGSMTSATLELYYLRAESFQNDNAIGIKPWRVGANRPWYENSRRSQTGEGVSWRYFGQQEITNNYWTYQSPWNDKLEDANGTNLIKEAGGTPPGAIAPLNWVPFDIRPSVLQWYGGAANNGLLLFSSFFTGGGTTLYGVFASRNTNNPALRPRLTLNYQGAKIAWSGAYNANWDTSNTNWWIGGYAGRYGDGDSVSFVDGAANAAVSVAAGGVAPASVTISNNSTGYSFSGGSIRGAGELKKCGLGVATLLASNSYTGATMVSNGVLNIRHPWALGDTNAGTAVQAGGRLELQNSVAVGMEPLTLNGNGAGLGALRSLSGSNGWAGVITLTSDTEVRCDAGSLLLSGSIAASPYVLTCNAVGDISLTSSIAGPTASVTKSGPGVLALAGGSSYGGGTRIEAGVLRAENATGSATGSDVVDVASGATLAGFGVVSGPVTIAGTVAPGRNVGRLRTGPESWAGGGT